MTRWLAIDVNGAGWPPPSAPFRQLSIEYDRGEVTASFDGETLPMERGADGVWRVRRPKPEPFAGSIGPVHKLRRPLTGDERTQLMAADSHEERCALIAQWGAASE